MTSVIAIVVTYERPDELLKNIRFLLNQSYQLKKIIIVDNGQCDCSDSLKILQKDSSIPIEYLKTNLNLGGAGGFEFGMKYCEKENFEYFYLLDDDAECRDSNSIARIMDKAEELAKSNRNILLNSLVVDNNNDDLLSFGFPYVYTVEKAYEVATDKIIVNHINPFNGTLVSKELIRNIGVPNKKYFIKGDETEFQLRAMHTNAIVATVVDSIIFHPSPQKFWINDDFVICNSPEQEYYRTRNYLDIYSIYFNKEIEDYLLMQYEKITTLYCESERKRRYELFYEAVFDFLNNNYGKKDFKIIKNNYKFGDAKALISMFRKEYKKIRK